MTEIPIAPLDSIEGYLPIEDHGLIGDGATAALVGRDGAIVWLCVPRFDADPLFARILDATRGGAFELALEGVTETRQWYEGETGILATELHSPDGTVLIRDALTLRRGADLNEDVAAGRGELLRHVEVRSGRARLRMRVAPYGGGHGEEWGETWRVHCEQQPDLDVHLSATVPLTGLEQTFELAAGEEMSLALRWLGWVQSDEADTHAERMEGTAEAWQRWMTSVDYDGPQQALVRRAAITLKMLDYFENGAMIAAPTSSLPETIGGARNWDYRYVWIRDAAFSVYAFHRIGLSHEAAGFLTWVLRVLERDRPPKILYDLDGEPPKSERVVADLEGYRRSGPVRWGNAAVEQVQHDVYGEILDCAYQWTRHNGSLGESLWERLTELVEAARQAWREPDRGIWEKRSPGRTFTYSAALCQVALDRGARLAEYFDLPGDVAGWRAEADLIRDTIYEEAWDPSLQSFTDQLGGGGALDASLLTLPLRRVIAADDPRMVATTEAIRRGLDAGGDGLVFRYIPRDAPDGLPGDEGAFLLCSFWIVDNLTMQGRLDEATALYDSLCARANPLGLLPEQIDPGSGMYLGNYPQAFSHIGLISSGINLAWARRHAGD
ncbi:MAG: glycoside hydrolase family 15 protein [Dehalococcoidia bacterium]